MPRHRWNGSKLQFEQAPGDVWGEEVDLKGPAGRDGIGGVVQTSARGSSTGNSYFPSGW